MCVNLDGVLKKPKYTSNINHNWKIKLCQFLMQVRFVIDHKWTTIGSLTGAGRHLLTKSLYQLSLQFIAAKIFSWYFIAMRLSLQ